MSAMSIVTALMSYSDVRWMFGANVSGKQTFLQKVVQFYPNEAF